MDEKLFLQRMKQFTDNPKEEERKKLTEYLYKIYATSIWNGVFHKFSEDKAKSDDITQETFLNVFASLHRVRGESMGEIYSYIKKIAANLLKKDFHKKSKERFLEKSVLDTMKAKDPKIDIRLDLAYFLSQAMPPENRANLIGPEAEIFRLWLEGKSHEEIREKMNISAGYIRVLIYRARVKVFEFLQKKGLF